jgi:hypothetical protein
MKTSLIKKSYVINCSGNWSENNSRSVIAITNLWRWKRKSWSWTMFKDCSKNWATEIKASWS